MGWDEETLKIYQLLPRLTVLPSDNGRSVMESMDRCVHGSAGIRRGMSLPSGGMWGVLAIVQLEQNVTKQVISDRMSGHQYFGLRSS